MSDPTKELIFQNEVIAQMVAGGRTALIFAAVTGKIDVRHWQPPSKNDAPAPYGKVVIHVPSWPSSIHSSA